MNAYGCVRCQTTHYEGDPVYRSHLTFQSKHGVRRASEAEWAYGRLGAAWARAAKEDDRLRGC